MVEEAYVPIEDMAKHFAVSVSTARAWIRQGSEKRPFTFAEKDHLRRNRDRAFHPGPWKCDRCGSWVGQLISVTLTNEGLVKNYDCDCGGQYWPST